MASLILVLREGAIKQALVTLDAGEPIDAPLKRVAASSTSASPVATAGRARARLGRRCRADHASSSFGASLSAS